jgi:hypothetical protein
VKKLALHVRFEASPHHSEKFNISKGRFKTPPLVGGSSSLLPVPRSLFPFITLALKHYSL